MDSVNKTLYIPLYGKSYVSQRGLILQDKTAEVIWAAEGFPLKGKAKSKWLAYSMGMRAAVFDSWLRRQMIARPDAAILHLGCGMDSRINRIGTDGHPWFDVDFPGVIEERKKYFEETDTYHMLPSDIREAGWLEQIPGKSAIVILEGVSMYLQMEELRHLLNGLCGRFEHLHILMDSYTVFGTKASKYKNPINEVGVTRVYGFDAPAAPVANTGLHFTAEHSMTPDAMIRELPAREQGFFKTFFAGSFAKKIYRLYEYEKGTE